MQAGSRDRVGRRLFAPDFIAGLFRGEPGVQAAGDMEHLLEGLRVAVGETE